MGTKYKDTPLLLCNPSNVCTVNKIGPSNIKMEISLEFRDIKGHLSIRRHPRHPPFSAWGRLVVTKCQQHQRKKGRYGDFHLNFTLFSPCGGVQQTTHTSQMYFTHTGNCGRTNVPLAIILMKCARVWRGKVNYHIESIKFTWSRINFSVLAVLRTFVIAFLLRNIINGVGESPEEILNGSKIEIQKENCSESLPSFYYLCGRVSSIFNTYYFSINSMPLNRIK